METLKVEQVYLAGYEIFEDVVTQLPRLVEEIYITERLHSAPGYVALTSSRKTSPSRRLSFDGPNGPG